MFAWYLQKTQTQTSQTSQTGHSNWPRVQIHDCLYISFILFISKLHQKKHLPCSHQSESSHLESSEMRSFWRKDLALKRPTHMKHRRSEETHVIGSWCLGLDVQGGPLPVISEQIPLPLFLKNPSFTHYKAIWVKNPPNIHWVSYPCH